MLTRRTPLKRTALKRRPKRDTRSAEEREYFEWLRTQPCAVSGIPWGVERSHIRRQRYGAGTGKKPTDWYAIPLQHAYHHYLHQYGEKTWETEYGSQESFLWATWTRYGLDKIPEDVRKLATVVKEPR